MSGMTEEEHRHQQEEVEVIDEGLDKEKKKKRHRSRRSKQNSSYSGTACILNNGTSHSEAMEWLDNVPVSINPLLPRSTSLSDKCKIVNQPSTDQGLLSFANAAFASLPIMHIPQETAERGSVNDQYIPNAVKANVLSRSCPEPVCHKETNGSLPEHTDSLPLENQQHADMRRTYFVPYWSADTVEKAVQKGDVYIASFRVNAHNRLEAYCTVDGLPTDVLISGVASQNRAIEGDTVAVKLDPLALWTKLKGSAGNTNNCTPSEGANLQPKVSRMVGYNCKGREKADGESELRRCVPSSSESSSFSHDPSTPIGKICNMLSCFPYKRPTGSVVAIIQKSRRREAVVGFLDVCQWLSCREVLRKETKKKRNSVPYSNQEYIQLAPNDAKFPKMLLLLRSLPDHVKERIIEGDATLGMELVAARIDDWREENLLPHARLIHSFGRGGEIEPQIAAVLFESAVCHSEFSRESLAYLPENTWEVPDEELKKRKDLGNICTFTIDPSTASDLDDALSIERVSDDIFRVGVHIADVSYFVLPGTSLDKEAQTRSTSVYLLQHKVPMLPPLLSENVVSLIPGVDRLSFSIIFDCNLVGEVVNRWIGHSVIRSCCKLSYQHAQEIIDGVADIDSISQFPELYGKFRWEDVIASVKNLYHISKRLKENRFKDGAVHLENSKLFFLFDEQGIPYDSMLSEQTDSNYLVEEFMLLANRTAAEVITRAYPERALLRRHPEPNARKLREFETFCGKHGLELDTSSSGNFNLSLRKIRETLQNDTVLFDILISYASRPMQLATYICTGDYKDRENEWAHYALAMPHYTHFTSPLRRYPDIMVHRTLSAAIEAEETITHQRTISKGSNGEGIIRKCFSSLCFDVHITKSNTCKEALATAALKHGVPCTETVAEFAAYCNEKRLACRHVEDAGQKLYLWALLNKKERYIVEARVLGVGPKFMSIYIHKLGMERRIYYDEVEGLGVEWLENTSCVILTLSTNNNNKQQQQQRSSNSNNSNSNSRRGGSPNSKLLLRPLEDVAQVVNPSSSSSSEEEMEAVAAAFPLTVSILSTIYVALHPIGGDDGPLDIGARLYMSSYYI